MSEGHLGTAILIQAPARGATRLQYYASQLAMSAGPPFLRKDDLLPYETHNQSISPLLFRMFLFAAILHRLFRGELQDFRPSLNPGLLPVSEWEGIIPLSFDSRWRYYIQTCRKVDLVVLLRAPTLKPAPID